MNSLERYQPDQPEEKGSTALSYEKYQFFGGQLGKEFF